MERFTPKMSEINWNDVLHISNVQNAYTMFYNVLCDVYTTCFPVKVLNKVIEPGNYGYPNGWRNREKLRTDYTDSTERPGMLSMNQSIDSTGINNLNRLLIAVERSHYDTILNENKNNLKKSWRILKQVINKKKDTSSCSKFLVNRYTTTDINIGSTLTNKIP